MRNYKLFFAAAVLLATTALAADSPAREFDWLSGHWCGRSGDKFIEEFWLPAAGDIAIGVGRTVKDGKTLSHEFMRIVTRDGVTSFIAVLEGQPPTAFKLTASGRHWARFENPQHDFPQRVEIRRTETGLHAEIAGPGKDGKEEVLPVDYTRCVD